MKGCHFDFLPQRNIRVAHGTWASGEKLVADVVILAAGLGCKALAATLGVALPVLSDIKKSQSSASPDMAFGQLSCG
eukprot:4776810-Amphidinium_carterae.3